MPHRPGYERNELERTLLLSGVYPDWHMHAEAPIREAYEQVIDFEVRTGLRPLIEDLKDYTPSTYVHSLRLGRAVTEWAVTAGMSIPEIIEAVASIEGHDIGKIAMAELIEYEGFYTEEQRALVRPHPEIGATLYTNVGVVVDPSDVPAKRQIVAQTFSHHLNHDDPVAQDMLSSAADSKVRTQDLHTLVRAADMIDAGSNLSARAHVRTAFLNGRIPSLQHDGQGGLEYAMPLLVTEITEGLHMDPAASVFDRSVGKLVEELAGFLPPVLPTTLRYNFYENRFSTAV